jgi:hypothetical protein
MHTKIISFWITAALIAACSLKLHAQINEKDSTVQVIAYWNKSEKQSYVVTEERYKVRGSDTSDTDYYQYKVDITVTDSTDASYTIDWFYHDHVFKPENELKKKIASIAENSSMIIMTDELGSFTETVNWRDLKEMIDSAALVLKQEYRDAANIDKIIEKLVEQFSSREVIETTAIEEILQFYAFHGGKYKLGEEVSGSLKMRNLMGGEALDSEVIIWLDEINPEEDNYIIRMQQTIDSEQLTKSTFDYLAKTAEELGRPVPQKETFQPVTNVKWTSARIHGSGWIIYSVETREIFSDGVLNVKERIIELE